MQISAKGQISATQLGFLIIGYIWGTSLILPPGSSCNQDAWLANLLGLAEGILFVLMYTAIVNRFPGKTLIEINDIVCGPYLGKIFSIAFLFYFFHLGSVVITNVVDFTKFIILPTTPSIIIALVGAFVAIVAATAGIEVLARSVTFLIFSLIPLILIIFILLIPHIKLINFQPFMETPLLKLLAASHGAATFPYGETVVFLMIFPHLNIPQKSRSATISAFLFGGMILILIIIFDIGVLGPTMPYFVYPSLSSSRLIEVGEVFTRLEVITGSGFLITFFIKFAVLIYGFMQGTAQLLKLNSYRTLAVPIGILISLLGIHNFASVVENIEFANKFNRWYFFPFEVGIPLFILLVAIIRRLPRKRT